MRLHFDANILIYAVEATVAVGDSARAMLRRVDAGSIAGCTSELTLAEVLAGAYRNQEFAFVDAYDRALDHGRLLVQPVSRAILREAARLVAAERLHLADAVHVATALAWPCDAFLSEDRRIRGPNLTVLTLASPMLAA